MKHLKKSGVKKANYIELNPTDWAIMLYLDDDTSKPFILNGGYRFYDSAYQCAEIVEQLFPQYLVSIQKFNETNVFAISEKKAYLAVNLRGDFMLNQTNLPYQLIFVYDDGDQFIAGKYGTLREALQAKIRCKHEIGQTDILGRVLEVITVLKGEENETN